MRILRFWIYLPLTFGIASLISFFAWSYFILGAILGILGVVFIYTIPFELDKKDENIIFSGGVLSYTGIMIFWITCFKKNMTHKIDCTLNEPKNKFEYLQ